jgi:hypothetical protein
LVPPRGLRERSPSASAASSARLGGSAILGLLAAALGVDRCGEAAHAARPEFSQAIARGKILADAEVAERLYQRACGYIVNATKPYRQDDGSVLQVCDQGRWTVYD